MNDATSFHGIVVHVIGWDVYVLGTRIYPEMKCDWWEVGRHQWPEGNIATPRRKVHTSILVHEICISISHKNETSHFSKNIFSDQKIHTPNPVCILSWEVDNYFASPRASDQGDEKVAAGAGRYNIWLEVYSQSKLLFDWIFAGKNWVFKGKKPKNNSKNNFEFEGSLFPFLSMRIGSVFG